jgi:hypothetical protein
MPREKKSPGVAKIGRVVVERCRGGKKAKAALLDSQEEDLRALVGLLEWEVLRED